MRSERKRRSRRRCSLIRSPIASERLVKIKQRTALNIARLRSPAHLLAVAAVSALALLATGCASEVPNRDPVGELFPDVGGEALDGKRWQIPADLTGTPAILLIGYVQDAQFDIDRWLLGILQSETPVPFLELPTIGSLAARAFKRRIDEGMRQGIPEEDWRVVVTLWSDDAERVIELTGNERPQNARVTLIDAAGRIAWFADQGYSARKMVELAVKVRELLTSASESPGDQPAEVPTAEPRIESADFR